MKKLNLIIVLVVISSLAILLIPGVALALDPISPVRDLPATVYPGETFGIDITFTANSDNFGTIGIDDYVPTGWTPAVNKTWCDPDADTSAVIGNKSSYIWFGPYDEDQAFTVHYHVTVPGNATVGTYSFDGDVGYKISGGATQYEDVAGDLTVEVALEPVLPTVTTQAATGVSYINATLNGNITATGNDNPATRGFQYGKVSGALNLDTHEHGSYGTGTFSLGVSSLDTGTLYYFRAYATNVVGTSYGSEGNFTTSSYTSPTLTTQAATDKSYTSATLNGNITSIDGINATVRGFEYDTNSGAPYAFDTHENGSYGAGTYSLGISSLTNNTLYYYRAYATNAGGTGYSTEGNFTTFAYVAASVTTNAATAISYTSATLNGNVTDIGTHNPTVRGFQYGKISGALNLDWHEDGSFAAEAFSHATGAVLDNNVLYYFRAYATNLGGTTYGAEGNFTTTAYVASSVTSLAATAISYTSATLNGNITNIGTHNPTVRGFQYGKISGALNLDWHENGSFIAETFSRATGAVLDNDATYYFRAYATNLGGTTYGAEGNFTTVAYPPAQTWTLTMAKSGNGTISPTAGAHNYIVAYPFTPFSVALVAESDFGWYWGNWTGSAVADASATSTTITMDGNKSVTANFIAYANNTAPGANVTVVVASGNVTFSTVASAGYTAASVESSPACGSLPAGYRILSVYYDIQTTAGYSGLITVGMSYSYSGNPSLLKIYHCTGGGWVDCTSSIDVANNMIYGQVASLSPFGIGEPYSAASQTRNLAQLAVLMIPVILILAAMGLYTASNPTPTNLVLLAIMIVVGIAFMIAAWAGIS